MASRRSSPIPFFTPPTEDTVPPIDVESEEQRSVGWQLMRHARNRRAGRNVFILSDNTATENDLWWINPGDPTVVRTFHGGRVDRYVITAAEKTILNDAGFTTEDV